jgi:hypothetical protein
LVLHTHDKFTVNGEYGERIFNHNHKVSSFMRCRTKILLLLNGQSLSGIAGIKATARLITIFFIFD